MEAGLGELWGSREDVGGSLRIVRHEPQRLQLSPLSPRSVPSLLPWICQTLGGSHVLCVLCRILREEIVTHKGLLID